MFVSIELINFINKAIAIGYDVDVLFYKLLATAKGDDIDYIKSFAVKELSLTEYEASKLCDYLQENVSDTELFELRNSFYEAELGRNG